VARVARRCLREPRRIAASRPGPCSSPLSAEQGNRTCGDDPRKQDQRV